MSTTAKKKEKVEKDALNLKVEETEKVIKSAETLAKKYETLVKDIESHVDKGNISSKIPKLVFPYQKMIRDLYIIYDELEEELEREKRQQAISFKLKRHKLSGLTLSATEQKSMIDRSDRVLVVSKILKKIERHVKFFETCISSLKNYSFNLNTMIEYRKLVGGV